MIAPNPWVVRYRTVADPSMRLICLPYAGGGASMFRGWSAAMPADVDVIGLQLPGRESRSREPAIRDMSELVPRLAEALWQQLDRDIVLFGHSMGALIAFELARELRRRGFGGPQRLIVSGRRPPQMEQARRDLHDLPHAQFIDELRSLRGTPEAILADSELMEILVPRLRADFALCETWRYRSEPPLDCPLTALAGIEDERCVALDGWADQTSADFSARRFPGGHFYLHEHADALLAVIRSELRATAGGRLSAERAHG